MKCRTVFFPRSLALANRRHFGETSKVPIGKSSLRIPENMCVHAWKTMECSSTKLYSFHLINSSLYVFLSLYPFTSIMFYEHIFLLGLFLYSLIHGSISGFYL